MAHNLFNSLNRLCLASGLFLYFSLKDEVIFVKSNLISCHICLSSIGSQSDRRFAQEVEGRGTPETECQMMAGPRGTGPFRDSKAAVSWQQPALTHPEPWGTNGTTSPGDMRPPFEPPTQTPHPTPHCSLLYT